MAAEVHPSHLVSSLRTHALQLSLVAFPFAGFSLRVLQFAHIYFLFLLLYSSRFSISPFIYCCCFRCGRILSLLKTPMCLRNTRNFWHSELLENRLHVFQNYHRRKVWDSCYQVESGTFELKDYTFQAEY